MQLSNSVVQLSSVLSRLIIQHYNISNYFQPPIPNKIKYKKYFKPETSKKHQYFFLTIIIN